MIFNTELKSDFYENKINVKFNEMEILKDGITVKHEFNFNLPNQTIGKLVLSVFLTVLVTMLLKATFKSIFE